MGSPEILYEYAPIKHGAGSVYDVADGVRAARQDWKNALESPLDEFEFSDPADAVVAVRDAWEKEFGVYYEVLERWCLATRAATEGTKSIDGHIDGYIAIQTMGAGGDRP